MAYIGWKQEEQITARTTEIKQVALALVAVESMAVKRALIAHLRDTLSKKEA